jgi:hypothetical protein|tara:strand:+ start:1190 stop:1990 length:801 start_codon:yes stop_codon:yes gene_type:complete
LVFSVKKGQKPDIYAEFYPITIRLKFCPRSGCHSTAIKFRGLLAGLILGLGLLTGCQTSSVAKTEVSEVSTTQPATKPNAEVQNLYASAPIDPAIIRVVVLPVHYPAFQEDVHSYLDELWAQALQRQNRFEIILLSREQIAEWTGRSQWSSTDVLPDRLRKRIEERYQPDAVMLCDLTRMESYQPLEIGLRAKLFEWHGGDFLWGVDGVWSQRPNGRIEARPRKLSQIFTLFEDSRKSNLDLATISPRYFYYHLVESIALTLPKNI